MSYKGSATPKATKYLKSDPLTMDFDASIDLTGSDVANAKTVQKEFQSEMDSRIKSQFDALKKWLAERHDVIDDLVMKYEGLKKEGYPSGPAPAQQRMNTMHKMAELSKKPQADQV